MANRPQHLSRRDKTVNWVAGGVVVAALFGAAVAVPWLAKHYSSSDSCERPSDTVDTSSVVQRRAEARAEVQRQRTAVDRRRDALAEASTPAARARLTAEVESRVQRLQQARAAAARSARVATVVGDEAVTVFPLGTQIDAGTHVVPFGLERAVPGAGSAEGPVPLQLGIGPFTRVEDSRELGTGSDEPVVAWATLNPGGRDGQVVFCIDPDVRQSLAPGTYSGKFIINDARLAPTDVAVTISLSYTRLELVMFVGLLVCVLSSFYVYFLRRPTEDKRPTATDDDSVDIPVFRKGFDFFAGYWWWATGSIGVLTIVAGMLAAATALSAQYLNADVWRGDSQSWLTFCGALATAFVAGGTAGRLAGQTYLRGGKGDKGGDKGGDKDDKAPPPATPPD